MNGPRIHGEPTEVEIDIPETPDVLHVPFGGTFLTALRADDMAVNQLLFAPTGEVMCVLGLASRSPDGGGTTLALYVPMRADLARTIAADLCRAADKIDQGKGKQ